MAEATRSYIESDGDLYRFVLKKIHYTDSGTYTIKASNCYGTQKAYCAVRVSFYMFFNDKLKVQKSALDFICRNVGAAGQGNGQCRRRPVGSQGRRCHTARLG